MNLLFVTYKDQKQNTNLFLLSPIALSIWTLKMEGNGVVGFDVSDKGGHGVSHISSLFSTASNKGFDLDYSNSW
jgi:hypothetical protein